MVYSYLGKHSRHACVRGAFRNSGVWRLGHFSDCALGAFGGGVLMRTVFRMCAIFMVLLVVMFTGAWAEGLQSWGEACTIAGICTVVAYLMLRGAGDV